MNHLMIDIEALGYMPRPGVQRQPCIVQIGLVPFDTDTGMIAAGKRLQVDRASEDSGQGPISHDTLRWWLTQDPATLRAVLWEGPRISLQAALVEVHEAVYAAQYVWAKGTDFDLRLLTDAAAADVLGGVIEGPLIPYYKWRDARVCYQMLGHRRPPRGGHTQHDALADATYQAAVVVRAFEVFRAGL